MCRRRGGGREDESGLVVEGEDNREEMVEEQIRPTGQMDTIRSSNHNLITWLSSFTTNLAKQPQTVACNSEI